MCFSYFGCLFRALHVALLETQPQQAMGELPDVRALCILGDMQRLQAMRADCPSADCLRELHWNTCS